MKEEWISFKDKEPREGDDVWIAGVFNTGDFRVFYSGCWSSGRHDGRGDTLRRYWMPFEKPVGPTPTKEDEEEIYEWLVKKEKEALGKGKD